MSELKQAAPGGDTPTAKGREQYQGQFDGLRLLVALALCVAVISVALYLR